MPLTAAQLDVFALPQAPRYAAKPTVPPEYKNISNWKTMHVALLKVLLAQDQVVFPPKSYEIGRPVRISSENNNAALNEVERSLEQFLSAPSGFPQQLPPGFNQGFSVANSGSPIASFSNIRKHPGMQPRGIVDEEIEGSGDNVHSSIRGIPNVYPDLARPPVELIRPHLRQITTKQIPTIPKIESQPEVPDGGFGPNENVIRRTSFSKESDDESSENEEYGTLKDDSSSSGGLIGTIINLIGENSPIPAKNMIADVLYKALAGGSIQTNGSDENPDSKSALTLTPAQQAVIGENLEMIQNLITQPSSPLCNPKPIPIEEFDVDAFMGQWYQVMYSPPLATGPCSMVAYKKLADVNDGGVGTIFEVFEYTTDGTPYVKPRISSGYAVVKQAGELIYRTTSYQDDVNVHIIHVGPLNEAGQYSFTILSTNCNYPLYVFARDPVIYKQRYETIVNQILEQKGLINGFSRLLNIVAPVDNSVCTFPPSRSSTVGAILILIFSYFSWINLPLSHSQLIKINDAERQPSLVDNAFLSSLRPSSKITREIKQNSSTLQSFGKNIALTKQDKITLAKISEIADSVLNQLGLSSDFNGRRYKPLAASGSFQNDDINTVISEANQNRIDLQGIASGQIPGLAPIPVPAFPGPQDVPAIPGVNTIPGLSNFNYLISQLFPQMIPPTNTLLGSSISRLVPKGYAKNLAKDVFRAVHPAAENVDVARMMGRWFQDKSDKEDQSLGFIFCSPSEFPGLPQKLRIGALTNNTYSATFTILKFYREGNANGPPRFSLGYGFKSGDTGQFVLHNSNSPDSEPCIYPSVRLDQSKTRLNTTLNLGNKKGPLNEYNQYDYVIVSNWVRFPVFVIARDPEQFRNKHMRNVLQFWKTIEITKTKRAITVDKIRNGSPVDYISKTQREQGIRFYLKTGKKFHEEILLNKLVMLLPRDEDSLYSPRCRGTGCAVIQTFQIPQVACLRITTT
ncbi:Protein CBR-LPR-5 [Dirofilaria immitis]|nr:Protein CBR-LPR-5 [Dirofilaria immitis]